MRTNVKKTSSPIRALPSLGARLQHLLVFSGLFLIFSCKPAGLNDASLINTTATTDFDGLPVVPSSANACMLLPTKKQPPLCIENAEADIKTRLGQIAVEANDIPITKIQMGSWGDSSNVISVFKLTGAQGELLGYLPTDSWTLSTATLAQNSNTSEQDSTTENSSPQFGNPPSDNTDGDPSLSTDESSNSTDDDDEFKMIPVNRRPKNTNSTGIFPESFDTANNGGCSTQGSMRLDGSTDTYSIGRTDGYFSARLTSPDSLGALYSRFPGESNDNNRFSDTVVVDGDADYGLLSLDPNDTSRVRVSGGGVDLEIGRIEDSSGDTGYPRTVTIRLNTNACLAQYKTPEGTPLSNGAGYLTIR